MQVKREVLPVEAGGRGQRHEGARLLVRVPGRVHDPGHGVDQHALRVKRVARILNFREDGTRCRVRWQKRCIVGGGSGGDTGSQPLTQVEPLG